MRIRAVFLLLLLAALASAQQAPQQATVWKPVTLADQFFEHNYFNYYAFVNGVYDSYAPVFNSNGQVVNNGSFGYNVGGGISGYHAFKDGFFSIAYSGDFRNSTTYYWGSGTDQNLSMSYLKRINRRWTINAGTSGGIYFYGTGVNSYLPSSGTFVQTNPFSTETKFLGAGLTLSYRQSRHLSYVVSGNFFLQRFNYPGSIGTTGGSGTGSIVYRVSPRLTIGGSYSHSYFGYQLNAGDAVVDGYYGNMSYAFPKHWFVNASAGVSHSDTVGVASLPVSLIIQTPNGPQTVGGYVLGRYESTANLPAFSVGVSRVYRTSSFSVSGGQAIVSGNGYYLASNSLFFAGVYSRTLRTKRANLSISGNYNRFHSVANTVGVNYSTAGIGASYGYNIFRHVSANFRYDFIRYGNLAPYNAVNDNRLSFGFSFSSQRIPLTIY
ncbi:MAG: hypothetical protein JO108_03455 [Acidobacteriaceae bacterium]|nr:hypothetical protein [Acidobacteriaceae bacterium]